ncbi:Orn/Lys/Arg decarboxylase N-terminal domain-containing protein, partial [uncultured Cetobacterium sp.]|uniref:Orn/Lys/Arg decarboxylase N-terminal domain-containing protein n=1 Tax=uncultured Cetobacterium sp. TaxID=527638 RepID=UPI00262F38FF
MNNVSMNWPLLVSYDLSIKSSFSERLKNLLDDFKCVEVNDINDFENEFKANQNISGIVLTYNSNLESDIEIIRKTNSKIPVIIVTDNKNIRFNLKTLESTSLVMDIYEDSIYFLKGQIEKLTQEYMKNIQPIFFGQLMNYVNEYKYPWHTPGHSGGLMFMTNPIGKMMLDFYGEKTLRSDLSISVPELGSLLDDEGPVKDAESNSARVFSADRTYYVLNGTSSVNQVIWKGRVTKDNLAFVDRNCHKSLNYGMVITEAIPMYMIPRRNKLGIIE